jgi:RNA-binding protein
MNAPSSNALSPSQRRELKARAHGLRPVVIVGGDGLSPAVLAEVDRALRSHELVKVRAGGADKSGRERLLEEICGLTGASPVQHIGKIIVVYRKNPEPPRPAARDSGRVRKSGTPGRKSSPARTRPSPPRRRRYS